MTETSETHVWVLMGRGEHRNYSEPIAAFQAKEHAPAALAFMTRSANRSWTLFRVPLFPAYSELIAEETLP